MKRIAALIALTFLFAGLSFEQQTTQKIVIDFLIKFGEELTQKTETFLHEQRRLGHESLLHDIEKNSIELEVLVNDLKNRSASVKDIETEQTLHEIHVIEHRLFDLENLLTEHMLIVKNGGNQPSSTPTPATTVHPTTLHPHSNDPVTNAEELVEKVNEVLKTYQGSKPLTDLISDVTLLDRYITMYRMSHNTVNRRKYLSLVEQFSNQVTNLLQQVNLNASG